MSICEAADILRRSVLEKKAKPGKVAIIAAMPEMLTAVWSVATHRRPFVPIMPGGPSPEKRLTDSTNLERRTPPLRAARSGAAWVGGQGDGPGTRSLRSAGGAAHSEGTAVDAILAETSK